MKRFVQGTDRTQGILLPERLEDYVSDDNPVRVVDVFVDSLDLQSLGFDGAQRRSADSAQSKTVPSSEYRYDWHASIDTS